MTEITANSLDHVALWVADRDALGAFACEHLGMHVIERTDKFTLVGADARQGKLTLFEADGPRERGVLERVVLRVSDLEEALARLPDGLEVERRGELVAFEGPEGLGLGLVEGSNGLEYDLDHVVLRVPDPAATGERLARLGFERRNGGLAIADRHLALERGEAQSPERPLLNHLAVLVDSVERTQALIEREGGEIDSLVDAANTLAVFVWGPDRIKLEYVEHKPGFSLV